MFSFLLGSIIFFGGIISAIFVNPFWGLVAAACFVHITPMQVHMASFRPVMVISIITLISYLLSSKYAKKFSYKPAEFWLMVLILLGMMASSINAYDKQATWDAVIVFAKFTIFFLLLVNIIDNRKKIYWWINGLLLSASWLVYRCWDLRGTTGDRFQNIGGGVVGDTNQFAAALILLLPLAVCRALQKDEAWWMRLGAATGAFGIIMSIILTVSRGAFIGGVVSFIAFFFYFKQYRKKLIILAVILSLFVAPFIPEHYSNRITNIFSAEGVEEDGSAQSKFLTWELSYELWQEHPIIGVGMDNFSYYMGFIHAGKTWGERGHVTHNIWLQALSEGGLLVFLPFSTLILLFFYRLRRAKKECGDNHIIAEISSLQVGMIGFLTTSLFVNRLFYEPIYWWCAMAIIYSRLLATKPLNKQANTGELPSKCAE